MRILLLALAFFMVGCQASYRIKPESLPQLMSTQFTLSASDGTTYNLSDFYENHAGTVVIFWQVKCPCVKRYQERVNQLFERYGKNDLAMFYVSSNTNETFSDAHNEFTKRKSLIPLLHDEGGKLAKAIGARGTPTAALFDRAGNLVFMGWIDNERYLNEAGRIAYLEDAIKDLLAAQPIRTNTSPMFGCPIR